MVKAPVGTTCQMSKKADAEDKCLHAVANPVVHPHTCKVGPARLRPHRAVMVSVKKTLERA
eukprot:4834327-Karenia_brevis.AAC.1